MQKILDESGCKPNKTWVDKGSEFYHRLMKSWLEDNDRDMYPAHNERKSVIAERTKSINTWLQLQHVSIDKTDGIVNKYVS